MSDEINDPCTVGFIFNTDQSRVLLVHKLKPSWQVGRLNGVGGKHEKDENAQECVAREAQEESALIIPPKNWTYVGVLECPTCDVDILTAIYDGDEKDAVKNDYEDVEWFDVGSLPDNVLESLHWLIPLCIDALTVKSFISVIVKST